MVRGPREGLIKNILTNTPMLRRKPKTPKLKMKPLIVGRETNTSIVVTVLERIADPQIVDEISRRISYESTIVFLIVLQYQYKQMLPTGYPLNYLSPIVKMWIDQFL